MLLMKSFFLSYNNNNLITLKLLKESSKVKKENISKLIVSFSDPFRLEIIDLMMDGEVCVCDIMKLTNLSQSRISYHIKILKEAGVITDRQEGRWVYYSLNKESLFLIKEWITSLTDYSSTRIRCCN
ncbi:Bacterial regulatory proteins, ArsR family [Prochlorococcus marinus subsp. pastoris str. CCMP1986]|uniref:Bacterial regulatory proteins, ArsR family n=2 Tax=Prochlorococcaceae TaxID=2881426 RepID=Q7V1Y1_PROMP|nr:Bacterial regulatory proteins, ArsR family [Prochlorococcus marinus subsp. pastoris str. CCMP1986]